MKKEVTKHRFEPKAEKVAKPKAEKPKVAPQVVVEPDVVEVPFGTYRLHDLMTTIGFPGFEHDFVRLLDKGLVCVNGDVVLTDEVYDVANGVLIEIHDKQFKVVGVHPEPAVAI